MRTSTATYMLPCRDCVNQPIVCDRIVGRTPTVLVLDYPTNLEAKRGALLQGDTGKLIRATLKAFDIDLKDIHVITALNCKPNTSRPKELRTAMECCRARLLRELRSLGAKKVLCLGTISYAALTSTSKIPRMDKVHGKWLSVYGMQLIGTYSPTRVIMDPEFYRDFYRAFEKFFTTDGREPWPDIRYSIPETVSELNHDLTNLGAFTDRQLSCDIETTGFSPFEDDILCIGFGTVQVSSGEGLGWGDWNRNANGSAVIITQELLDYQGTWFAIASQLRYGCTAFHGGKFDLKFIIKALEKFGIDCVFNNIDDTLLLNYCLDERPWGKYGAHSLKNISRVRYDAPDYDIEVGKWLAEYKKATPERQQEMLAELYGYLALDCYYTARLATDLRNDVEKESDNLLDLYEWLLVPASLALTEIELRGCKLDRNYLEGMKEKLTHDLEVSTQKIREYVEDPDFNPGSVKQTHNLLYKTLGLPVTKTERKGKLQEGPTSQPVIKILRSRYPEYRYLFDEIIKWRGIKKTLGTYINGLLDRMESDDRVRSDFLLHGTGTGRISSVNPNLQNISVESHTGFDIRTAFIPEDDDWLLIESDYSQLELRVAAHLTGDENFIQAYIDGRDLHKDAATAVFRKDSFTDYERVMSKNMVFGAMYDRGAPSIAFGPEMDYLVNELGGTRWTLNEVDTFFKRFFAHYPGLREWQAEQKQIVYRDQQLETELGRLRRFPLITGRDNGAVGRQGINTPIQSLASDITLDALIRIHARLKRLNRKVGRVVAHIILTVHDSILTECRRSYAKQVKRIIAEEMSQVPIDTVVPFVAKITTGKNRGSLK